MRPQVPAHCDQIIARKVPPRSCASRNQDDAGDRTIGLTDGALLLRNQATGHARAVTRILQNEPTLVFNR
jgi:hypothetical protein